MLTVDGGTLTDALIYSTQSGILMRTEASHSTYIYMVSMQILCPATPSAARTARHNSKTSRAAKGASGLRL